MKGDDRSDAQIRHLRISSLTHTQIYIATFLKYEMANGFCFIKRRQNLPNFLSFSLLLFSHAIEEPSQNSIFLRAAQHHPAPRCGPAVMESLWSGPPGQRRLMKAQIGPFFSLMGGRSLSRQSSRRVMVASLEWPRKLLTAHTFPVISHRISLKLRYIDFYGEKKKKT